MTTLEALRQGRARIAQGWCQGVFARNPHGIATPDDDARSWCAVGAIRDLDGISGIDWSAFHSLTSVMSLAAWNDDLAAWNDAPERTQADVLALYDRAIAAEEAEATP